MAAFTRDLFPFESGCASECSVMGTKFAFRVLVASPSLAKLTVKASRLPADVVFVLAGECLVLRNRVMFQIWRCS